MMKLKVPSWEDPYERFFAGRGELALEDPRNGASCVGYLWELVVLPDSFFSLDINGHPISRSDILRIAAFNLAELVRRVPQHYRSRFMQACSLSEEDWSLFDEGSGDDHDP